MVATPQGSWSQYTEYLFRAASGICLAISLLLAAGCAQPQTPSDEQANKQTDPQQAQQIDRPPQKQPRNSASESVEHQYIGLTTTQARELARSRGVSLRVIKIDGERLAVTLDFVRGRVNAELEDGLVSSVQIEGAKPTVQKPNKKTQTKDENCLVCLDGYNQCRRSAPSAPAARTKMACAEHGAPRFRKESLPC